MWSNELGLLRMQFELQTRNSKANDQDNESEESIIKNYKNKANLVSERV